MAVEIIAEVGLNHNNHLPTAMRLAAVAKQAGANIMKTQTYVPEKSISAASPDFKMLKRLAMSFRDTLVLARQCETIGIEFMSTPDDLDSLKFLVQECGVKRIKLGSGSMLYQPLVEVALATGLPLIVSTGGATLDEVRMVGCADRLTLMHCVSLYPCPVHEANLRAILTLRKWNKRVGWSDHTPSIRTVPAIAVAYGACMIEKHLTLDRQSDGPDHHFSLEPNQFTSMVHTIRDAEAALGDGEKKPSPAEAAVIARVRKDANGFQAGI